MASVIGTCKLCLENELRLVDSHIIPRSFYEEYKGKPLIAFSQKNDKTSTIRKGIFDNLFVKAVRKNFVILITKRLILLKMVKTP